MRGVKWGPQGNRIVKAENGWKEPLKWDREAKAAGERRRVFCASLADVFEDWKGDMLNSGGERLFADSNTGEWQVAGDLSTHRPLVMQDVRDRLFRLIDATPNLDWLLLTKRPENIAKMMPERDCDCSIPILEGAGVHSVMCNAVNPRKNLWLGVSCENQQTADERIPHLLRVPASIRFLSCEPLLGPVDLHFGRSEGLPTDSEPCRERADLLHWVIVGGESGAGARPCDVAWVRSIAQQCKEAGVACFVKQLGAKPFEMRQDPTYACEHEEERFIRLIDKKGGDPAEWPEDLRVREFPR